MRKCTFCYVIYLEKTKTFWPKLDTISFQYFVLTKLVYN